jgi:hypothetical protein
VEIASLIDMDTAEQHQEIMTNLAVVINRLENIDKRLDTLNGKVAMHSGQINKMELWKAKMEGAALPFQGAWVVFISLISGLAVLFWNRKV